MVVVAKIEVTTAISDIALPNDFNVEVKEIERVDKYQALREKVERAWKITAIAVPVVVVGAPGILTPNSTQWFAQIACEVEIYWLLKSALLETGKIW